MSDEFRKSLQGDRGAMQRETIRCLARNMHCLILLLPNDPTLDAVRRSSRELADAALGLAETLEQESRA